ncbi:MAG: ATP-dependent DNA helicase RecG [Propionibacteriaceae bacterium]
MPPGRYRTRANGLLAQKVERVLGDKTAKQLAALRIVTVADLMHHLPRRYLSGTELSDLSTLHRDEEVAVIAEVVSATAHRMNGRGRSGANARLEVKITDHKGSLGLAFFGRQHLIDYWQGLLRPGVRGIFAGKVGEFNGRLQLTHPDFVTMDETGTITGGAKRNLTMAKMSQGALIGLYPATRQLPTWNIAECTSLVLDHLQGMSDPLPAALREEAGMPELLTAFESIHRPQSRDAVRAGRERLRFDEAFGIGLTMAVRRADAVRHGAVPRVARADGLLTAFDATLPFTLTGGQQEVSAQLFADLAQSHPMQRLLQGEVGSGKTLVALRAMLAVVDAGGQAALLAPTEVLAGQHLHTTRRLLGELAEAGTLAAAEHATRVILLTGSTPAAARRTALLQIAAGEAGIVVGTHALLSETVQFADLGLVVVDEQHRFGVEQRAALAAKASQRPHVLVMTATPIPRSVAMTVFGDLEVSTLREIPAGRSEVSSVVVDTRRQPAWVDRAWSRIREEVGHGRQAFVVCPRISSDDRGPDGADDPSLPSPPEGPELPPAAAVEDLYAELTAGPLKDLRVAMLHGRQRSDEKEAAMAALAAGETDVLVATTVVEVGVDVPNASVMVVCDADRFGISQLHQLRGRIGRGAHPGVCLLLTAADVDTPARERLDAVAATRDGFALAEIDLEQRREGDVLGASQSGVRSSLRLLRVVTDAELITTTRALADRWVADDPGPAEVPGAVRLAEPGLDDMVTRIESQSAAEWLERS